MSRSKHLYLAGFRGTGKTSVGVVVAKAIGRTVIDLDQVIEANAGRSIREIFEQGGESRFRELESRALSTVSEAPAAVISLGGGAILSAENRRTIANTGVCFWLDATPETIAERIRGDVTTSQRRPALTTLDELEEIEALLQQRRGLYEAAATCRIDTTGKSVDDVADEILGFWVRDARPDREQAE